MATPVITDKHLNKMKVLHTFSTTGQIVLHTAYDYQYVKPYMGGKNIKEHLIHDLGWTEAKFKKQFDNTMINKIETSRNNGSEYDITLLLKCKRVLSEYYDPGGRAKWTDPNALEYRCKILKDRRNSAFHSISGIDDAQMVGQLDNINNALFDILDSLKVHHPSEAAMIDDMKRKVKDDIHEIRRLDLSETAIADIRKIRLKILINKLKAKIPAYKNKCKEWGIVQILDFLMGSNKIHEVKMLFTEIVVEKSHFRQQNTNVKCSDIFIIGKDAVILIDSETGGGKTTLFRFGISDWSEGGGVMNINDYDLIFPMLFRNPHISSVKEMIKDLFPEASKEIDIEDIMDLIINPSLKIAFFCDGFDEKNPNSRQLFSEICELKRKNPHLRIVCTSRPESVREFYNIVGKDHTIEHLKALGIKESDRPAFLKKYHDEMIKAGISKQNSDDLLAFYLRQSARHKDLYRLPINLVILAWIWGLDPKQAQEIKSAAGLYSAIIGLLNRKLVDRLRNHPNMEDRLKANDDELLQLIDGFKEIVYSESLKAIIADRIYIDDIGVKRLKDYCYNNSLPYSEMIGAFLLCKLSWENIGDLNEVLEVPHKGFLDHFASMFIALKLGQKLELKLRNLFSNEYRQANKIKKIILNCCHENRSKLEIDKFQNVVQLCGGNLSLKSNHLLERYGNDIIDLLKETGVRNNVQWYDTYSVLNVNQKAAENFGKLIAPNLNLENFLIKDSNVDILTTLLQFVNISKLKVTLDITSNTSYKDLTILYDILVKNGCEVSVKNIDDNTFELWNQIPKQNNQLNIENVTLGINNCTMHLEFPSFMQALNNYKCKVTVKKIDDTTYDLWNNVITTDNPISLDQITLDSKTIDLPFLNKCSVIKQCKLLPSWRRLTGASPNMAGCKVNKLYTSVSSIKDLPVTVTDLRLGLLTDASGNLLDPGLRDIRAHCTQLEDLGVHVEGGAGGVAALPQLPQGLRLTSLYLSKLQPAQLNWAASVASALQPQGDGFYELFLPGCGVGAAELVQLWELLRANNVKIGWVFVSSVHTAEEMAQVEAALTQSLGCDLFWYQDDNELPAIVW